MKAIIITIGDEILIGQTLDTNSRYVAKRLTTSGFDVTEMLTISDDRSEILRTVDYALTKVEVVIVTGGLGPTKDDLTKKVLTEYFGGKLVFSDEVLGWLEERLRRRGLTMNENIRTQAIVPDNCKLLHNFAGTACGMWWERNGHILVSLPGVPFEMEHLTDTYIIPELQTRFPNQQLDYRCIKCYEITESNLAIHLEDWENRLRQVDGLGLAYLPTPGMVKLRITAKGNAVDVLYEWYDSLKKELKGIKTLEGDNSNEVEIGNILRKKQATLSTAESCTGGYIAHLITSVSGSSEYFRGSVVAYTNDVKTQVLGVNADDIQRETAVSETVVKQMAEGARRVFGTDYAVSTSGVAGPLGGTEATPVGTVWVAVAMPTGTITKKFCFPYDRMRNITKAAEKTLELLGSLILKEMH